MAFASQPALQRHLVTRAEYQESGSAACRRKFKGGWQSNDAEDSGGGGKGKGKARQEEMDWESDEVEEVVPAKRGTRGRGRASVGGTKKK